MGDESLRLYVIDGVAKINESILMGRMAIVLESLLSAFGLIESKDFVHLGFDVDDDAVFVEGVKRKRPIVHLGVGTVK